MIRIALVDPDPVTREELAKTLKAHRGVSLDVVLTTYEQARRVSSEKAADLVLIAVDSSHERALDLIRVIKQDDPTRMVIPASRKLDVDVLLQFVRAGAPDYLQLPTTPEALTALLERIPKHHASTSGRSPARRNGRVIAVTGASGGVGCSSLAVNLAAVLAEDHDASVALLDLDLLFGTVAAWLNLNPERGLIETVEIADRLDQALLRRAMIRHPGTGINVLTSPESLEDVGRVDPEALRRVINLTAETFDYTFIDTSKSLHVTDMVALERADIIFLVVQCDLMNLFNTARLLTLFRKLNDLDQRVHVVLNRVGSDAGSISIRKVEDTLGKPVSCQIPNAFRVFHTARTLGAPIDRRGGGKRVCQSLDQLAALVVADQQPVEEGSHRPAPVVRRSRFWSAIVGGEHGGTLQPV